MPEIICDMKARRLRKMHLDDIEEAESYDEEAPDTDPEESKGTN